MNPWELEPISLVNIKIYFGEHKSSDEVGSGTGDTFSQKIIFFHCAEVGEEYKVFESNLSLFSLCA